MDTDVAYYMADVLKPVELIMDPHEFICRLLQLNVTSWNTAY